MARLRAQERTPVMACDFCDCNCNSRTQEVERLRSECFKLAHLLMSGLVFVHESKITEVDLALAPYLGDTDKCRPASR
jgi:hypothetical protein